MASLNQHVKRVHKKETPRIPKTIKRRNKIERDEPSAPLGSEIFDTHPSDEPTSLCDLDVETLSPQHKKVKDDWFVVFNPDVPRLLDLDLVHTLAHESVVVCVRFSMDGKFVATGCNKSAQIFDAISGEMTCVLQDEFPDPIGDNYVRAVCFSPDGRYLVTGREDKLIMASSHSVNTPAGFMSLTDIQQGLGHRFPYHQDQLFWP